MSQPDEAPEICELPHQTVAEEDACEAERLAAETDTRWCCNGNAEECALCVDRNLPYPFICPGHEDTPENRRTVLMGATDEGKAFLKETMRRLRRHDKHPEPSAIEAWAHESDLAEALGGFGDGYRRAQTDAQIALGLDRIRAKEQAEAAVEANLDGVSLQELRAHVSRRLVELAQYRCVAEWICCDPVDPTHLLCVQGNAARTMMTALLTDDETVFPPKSELLDEVMRLVLGHAEISHRNNVLSTAEVRELYGKAVTRGLQTVVDWDGMDDLKPLKANVIHAIMAEVVTTRDRELARNRQRLLLADDRHARTLQDEALQHTFDEAKEAEVRRDERLKVLDEVAQLLREENQTPYDTIALSGPMARLRKMRKTAEKGLDKPE